jgi:hypothetical protein
MFPTAALIGVILSLGKPMPVHDIYTNLMNDEGANCCDDTDCRPAPYRLTPSGVLMQIDGNWIEVPSEVILYRALPGDDGRTGGGHWCGICYEYLGMGLTTRCAVLPPNSALSTISIP